MCVYEKKQQLLRICSSLSMILKNTKLEGHITNCTRKYIGNQRNGMREMWEITENV